MIAVGRTMPVKMCHMWREGADDRELGADGLDKLQPQRLTHYLVKRRESLGRAVTLQPLERAG
jgi:hypothetical protein